MTPGGGTGGGDPRDLIAAKRDGHRLDPDELRAFVLDYARGELPDYQAAALLMAACINGLDDDETLALTRAMVGSGETLALDGISRPKVDKHSTGGVADGVTLAFAPLAAALGLAVAKLSGRGLGHTGGTLDKLEAIPGLRTDLDPAAFERQVEEVGSAVAAQSADLVPADGALYALRDATATVPSIPLIAASVMSKKLAVGTDLVLLDVKAGSGAFMKTPGDAAALAEACTTLAAAWGAPDESGRHRHVAAPRRCDRQRARCHGGGGAASWRDEGAPAGRRRDLRGRGALTALRASDGGGAGTRGLGPGLG